MKFPSLRIDYDGLKKELGYPGNCAHNKVEIRRKLASNKQWWFWNQCLDCGAKAGNRVPAKAVSERETVPFFDEEISRRVWQDYHARHEKREQEERNRLRETWNRCYADYLQTEEWLVKRELVLHRAQGICEGCRKKRASQVHHTTYANVGQEFLFELVALCGACHSRYHERVFPQFLENLWWQGYGRTDSIQMKQRPSDHVLSQTS